MPPGRRAHGRTALAPSPAAAATRFNEAGADVARGEDAGLLRTIRGLEARVHNVSA